MPLLTLLAIKRKRMAAVCLMLLLLLAGCSGPTEKIPSPTASPVARANAPVVQTNNVEILAFKFLPDVQSISAGTTISWVNNDPYFHTVTSGKTDGPVNEPDGTFDFDLKDKGDVINITFDKPGVYSYFCKQHNAMNAEIRVS